MVIILSLDCVSTKYVTGCEDESGWLLGLANGLDLVLNQVMRSIPCTIKGKPLVLPWGRTPRLDSGVRVSPILGFPNISLISVSGPKWAPCLARVRDKSCFADADSLPRMFLDPRQACHIRLASSGPCQYGIGLSSGPSYFEIALLGLGPISRNYTLDEDTYPQFLRENGEEMDLFSFIRTADPTKVRVGERQRAEDEPKLLDTTVGRVVPLLPVAPAPGERELEDSVDRLFDEGSNGDQVGQGDAASGGQNAGIQFGSEVAEVVAEDVAPLQPRRQKKRKTVVVDAGPQSRGYLEQALMDILCLDETLAERLGLDASQPHVDQLIVPVHNSPDQTVVGARALSLSLDISHSRVQRIKENIVNNRSALHDIFVSFSEPLSIVALEGTEGTSGAAPDTTTTLSTTHASASSIPLISTDDYVVAHEDNQESTGADGQAGVGTDVNPFPNVDDAELDVSQ
ncbi:hypothetical protein Tco_0709309 [Tanacetum coccineum]